MEYDANRIYRELISEDASIWYIADNFGAKIMIKLPTVAIRAIVLGSQLDFLFGRDGQFLYIGIKLYDDPVSHLAVTGLSRYSNEHAAIHRIFCNQSTPVEFYNELDVCLAQTMVSFPYDTRTRITDLLGDVSKLYSGDMTTEASRSLDCFDFSVSRKTPEVVNHIHEIPVCTATGSFSSFVIMKTHFVGTKAVHEVEIDDKDEGTLLEKLVWASLESLFEDHIHKNPLVSDGNKRRELTDILSFYQHGVFLVETKALSVTTAASERSMDRKVAGVQKQVEKAINQLIGAAKSLRKKQTVYDNSGKELVFIRDMPPHSIVLVSDLLPFGDWTEIELKMFDAMQKTHMFLNVMDLTEFLKYVKASRGQAMTFDYHLINRTKAFVANKTIHIESRLK